MSKYTWKINNQTKGERDRERERERERENNQKTLRKKINDN